MTKPMIGILGAGKLGVSLGQLARQAGYSVGIAASGPAEKIELTVEILVPGAKAYTTEELTRFADIIILAVPLSKYQQIDSEWLKDKLVIDAMNYWWEVDGTDEVFSDEERSSSERVQEYFNESLVVKAFNHMGYHDLVDHAKQGKTENRKAILVAGDDKVATDQVEGIVDDFGFTPLNIGPLKNGVILETGQPLFGASLGLEESKEMVKHSLEEIRK
ncbi:NADPH-dependent F420 reductase [Oceanobacillus sp. CAU 1775]